GHRSGLGLATFAVGGRRPVGRGRGVDRLRCRCVGRLRFGGGAGQQARAVLVRELIGRAALTHRLDGDDPLVLADAHDLHALCVAPGLADFTDGGADGLAAVGDQHHLVFGLDQRDADHGSVALAAVDQDDALAAPVLTAKLFERGALAVPSLAHRQHLRAGRLGRRQADDLVVVVELDGLDACRVAPRGPHLLLVEADALALLRRDQKLARAVGDGGGQQLVVLGDFDADDALLAVVLIVEHARLFDLAAAGEGGDEQPFTELRDGRDRRDALALLKADEVDDGAALGRPRRQRDLVHLLDVELAAIAEEEDVAVGRGNEELVDEIVARRLHPAVAFAAALLRLVGRKWRALDVAGVRDGDDHVLFLDQVFDLDLCLVLQDLRAAVLPVLLDHLLELGHDEVHEQPLVGEDGAQARDLVAQRAVLLGELLLLEPGESRQAHLQDRLRLTLAQAVVAGGGGGLDLLLRPARAAHERLEPLERQLHQALLGDLGIGGFADGLDDQVDLGHRHPEALDDLALTFGLGQLEAGAAAHHLSPVLDEQLQRLFEVEDRRAAVDDRQVDDAEGRLHVGQAIELIEDDLREDVLFELDHQPHAVPVALVAGFADALDALVAHQLADLRVQSGLVHLIGDLGHHDLFAVAAGDLLDLRSCAHHDAAATGFVGLVDAGAAVDEPTGREVRPRD